MTKYAEIIKRPEDTKFILEKAYYIANEGRPGPVWIDVPLDIQNKEIKINSLKGFKIPK